MKEPAKEIISLEFLMDIERLRQDRAPGKWDTIIQKIEEFSHSDPARLTPVDPKNSILHVAYGEALLNTGKREEGIRKIRQGLEIQSLVLLLAV